MPSKKPKGDEEPPKALSFYVKDRLELTKQLFSCLKSKQIKSRLPANLQNKSMERIQQICLDEILGISSKRLLSIINNTKCPADTESDSDIEHISLSEISSESDNDEIAVVSSNASKAAGNLNFIDFFYDWIFRYKDFHVLSEFQSNFHHLDILSFYRFLATPDINHWDHIFTEI